MKLSAFAAVLAASVFATPLVSHAKDLTVGLAASTTSMDPQFYVVGPNSAMARNIFDGLVNQDEKQQIQPALALSWAIIDDTTWEPCFSPSLMCSRLVSVRRARTQWGRCRPPTGFSS